MSLCGAPLEQAGQTLTGGPVQTQAPRPADSGPTAGSLEATPLGRCGGHARG